MAAAAYNRALLCHARGDLLDLGCGTVPLYGLYHRLVQSVTCVDWPNTPHSSMHVDVAADLNLPLPFRCSVFDTVLLTDVLEHLAQPDLLVAEVARVLRAGGTLVVGVPFMYEIHEAPHDHHRYTEFRLRAMCEAVGLRVARLEPYGDTLHVWADVTAKLMYRRGRATGYIVDALQRAAAKHRPRAGTGMPLGYVVVATLPSH